MVYWKRRRKYVKREMNVLGLQPGRKIFSSGHSYNQDIVDLFAVLRKFAQAETLKLWFGDDGKLQFRILMF